MKDILRAAQAGTCFLLLAVAGLSSGCSNDKSDEPLLTIDSKEMQAIQADIESEQPDAAENGETPSSQTVAAETPDATETAPGDETAATEPVEQVAAVIDTPQPNQPSGPTPDETPGAGNAAPSATAVAPPETVSSEPREVKLLVPQNSFQKVGPEDALRVSYDDLDLLKVLNMEPVTISAPEQFPKWLKELDGKRIRLRGFMFPPFSNSDIPAFVLARDNQICCFGRNPKPYDVIQIVMRKGVTVDYIQNRPFDVVGTFHIDLVTYDDKSVDGLYLIDDAIVIDK